MRIAEILYRKCKNMFLQHNTKNTYRNCKRWFMQEKEIKIHFEAGNYSKCEVLLNPMETGYLLAFWRKSAGNPDILRSFRRQEPRVFKTIDAAVKCAKEIGFRRITIVIE